MWFGRLRALLPLFLLLGGFPCPGFLQHPLVSECRGETPTNLPNTIIYSAEATLEQKLLTLTSHQRIQQGLQELIPDEILTQIARDHSHGMAQQGFISHDHQMFDNIFQLTHISRPIMLDQDFQCIICKAIDSFTGLPAKGT